MTRHYSVKNFLRQMPNALLARYLARQGVLQGFEFAAITETKIDPLFAAWLELPEPQRHGMDAEFAEIFAMSCEKGWLAILDEARWQMRADPEALSTFVDVLAALPNHYHRAMVTFLDYHPCWKGATRFFHADNLTYWRKRKNMGHRQAAVDQRSIGELARQIRTWFHHTEGRGTHCVVEPFRRGELDYFFAYPEDYSQQSIEWVGGEFGRRPHNPAFEVVFVYSQQEGTLDLNFRGSNKAVEPLQGIFATTILKLDELPANPKDSRVYDLNPLRLRDFQFVYGIESGIERVVVKKLRLSSRVTRGDRITLEADTARDPERVYTLADRVGKSVPLSLYNVTQVELAATVVVDAEKPAKTVTIRITHPNSCSLKYDELDLRLRDMLEASGIEPREPSEDEGAGKSQAEEVAEV